MIENWICPNCNEEINILDEFSDNPEHEEEIDCTCYKCWKDFKAMAYVNITFSCYK